MDWENDSIDFGVVAPKKDWDFSVLNEQPRAAVGAAMGQNPADMKTLFDVSNQTGVPPGITQLDPKTTLDQWQAKEAARLVDKNPAYAKLLTDNPFAARTTIDDVKNLVDFANAAGLGMAGNSGFQEESPFAAFGSGVTAGFNAAEAGREAIGPLLRGENAVAPQSEGDRSGLNLVTHAVAKIVGMLGSSAPGAVKGAAAGALIGTGFAGVGAAPGAAIGGTVGFLYDTFLTATGQSYQVASNVTDKFGNKLPTGMAAAAAVTSGLIQTALNTIPVEKVAPIGPIIDRAITGLIQKPLIQNTLLESMKSVGEAGLAGAAVNMAGMLVDEASRLAAQGTSGQDFETILNSPEKQQELVNGLILSGVVGAVTVGGLKSVPVGLNMIGDRLHQTQVKMNQSRLDQLMQIADQSQTHERSREVFGEYARNLMGSEEITIPVDVVRNHMEDFAYVEDLQQQVGDLGEAAGDVRIPAWQFVTQTPIELYQAIRDEVKGANGVSAKDMTEMAATGAEALPRLDPIFNDIQAMLSTTKLNKTQVDMTATVLTSYYHTRAQRLGLESEKAYELFKNQGLEIKPGDETGLPPDVLYQLAGVRALKARLPALASAKEMTANGENPSKIWAQTGWWQSPQDGQWRFEIPDDENRTYNTKAMDKLRVKGSVRLGDLYNHRALFENYPQLKDTLIHGMDDPNYYGVYYPASRSIMLNMTRDLVDIDSTLVHELQHAVQHIEGFDSGHNPQAIRQQILSGIKGQLDSLLQRYMGGDATNKKTLTSRIMQVEEKLRTLASEGDDFWFQIYRRITGEVEARNVQKRLEMRDRELKMLSPEDTAEFKGAELIRPDRAEKTFLQNTEHGIRGAIQLSDGQAIISIFDKANASTAIHEGGHLFLYNMVEDAKISPEIAGDLGVVMDWLGVKSPEEIGRKEHEKFAQGFEAYMRDGKAPIKRLEAVFNQFKKWLTKLYTTVDAVGGPISEEVRGVFDRMIATSESEKIIKQALRRQRRALWLDPIVDNKALGMTVEQFKLYSKHLEKAQEELDSKAAKGALNEVKRTETQTWQDALKIEVDAATNEVRSAPVFRVDEALRTGKMPDGSGFPYKIDAREVAAIDQQTKINVNDLPKGAISYSVGNTLPLDTLATMFGFKSGRQLLKQLGGVELARRVTKMTPDEYMAAEIKDLVSERMEKRFGTLDEKTLEHAIETMTSNAQLAVLVDELSALGGRPLSLEEVSTSVAQKFGDMALKTGSNLRSFEKAVAAFGRKAEVMLLKGKHTEAFQMKQRQFINLLLAKNAKQLEKEVTRFAKTVDRFKKATVTGLPVEFNDQLHATLQEAGFKTGRDPVELGRGLRSREAFVTELQNAGYDVNLPDFMESGIPFAYKNLKVSEARDFMDFVQSLTHIGKAENVIEVSGEKLVKEIAVKKTIDKIDKLPAKLGGEGRAAKFIRSVDASLSRIEFLFSRLEGHDGGPLTQVFREMSKGKIAELDRSKKFSRDMQKILDREWTKTLGRKIDNDILLDEHGRPMELTKSNLVAMALNLGNEGNKERLLTGRDWSEADVRQIIDENFTKLDWDKVQEIWNLTGRFWPEAEALSREMSGVGLKKVDETPVQTQYGDYKGGYYPIMYENSVAEPNAFSEGRFRLYTPRGYTKRRAKTTGKPVELSFDSLPQAMSEVIHDLSFRKPLAEARKLLNDRTLRKAIDVKYGGEYVKAVDKWLNHVAIDTGFDHKAVAWWEGLVKQSRINMTMAVMAYNVKALMDLSPILSAAGEIGGVRYGRAMATMLNPRNTADMVRFARDNSGEVRHRLDLIDNNVREGLRRLEGKRDLKSQALRFGFYGFGFLDAVFGMPLWHAAYDKATQSGASHVEAVARADASLRRAQGSGHTVDVAEVLRSNEMMKTMTMFYSWFNTAYNNVRDIPHYTRKGTHDLLQGNYESASHDMAMVISKSFWWVFMMAVSDYFIRGAPGNEDDDAGKRFAAVMSDQLTGTIPFVRDIGKWLTGQHSNPDTPTFRIAKETYNGLNDVFAVLGGEEASDKWVKHAINTPGYIFGIPGAGQAATTAQFLWDLKNGDQTSESASQLLRGLIWGKAEKAP